jgi:hypothetical protein
VAGSGDQVGNFADLERLFDLGENGGLHDGSLVRTGRGTRPRTGQFG